MKLLRSTFVAFCLAIDGIDRASAFVAPRHAQNSAVIADNPSSSLHTSQQTSTTRLSVGLHEPSPSSITDEVIRKENEFRQVLKEVNAAKGYLDYLIETTGVAAEAAAAEEAGPTFAEVLAEKAEAAAAGNEVELFGGGGDAATIASETPKERAYAPSLRSDLGSTVVLSGTVDPALLAALNNNFFGQDSVPNFAFARIKAYVDDVASAKKRAISREARYGGLLDKLVIERSSAGDASMPTAEELAGAGSWIARVDAAEAGKALPRIARLAGSIEGLNNVVVVVVGAASGVEVEGWDAVTTAAATTGSFKATLLAVGELHDDVGKQGGFTHVADLAAPPSVGASAAAAAFDSFPTRLSTKKAYQIAAHALALDCTVGRALSAKEYPSDEATRTILAAPYGEGEFAARDEEGNELPDKNMDVKMEGRMIQAMREVGFTQLMELDVLVGRGVSAFKEYVENPPERAGASSTSSSSKSTRDEEDARIMALLEADIAKSKARKEAEAEEAKRIEIEGIAKEWAIKEYSLRMLGGIIDESVSEQDFMISSREEALAEARKTYNYIHSEEYVMDRERKEKAKVGVQNKLFWDGMPMELRKKREKLVERVKRQYMDLLSEEELERIILSE